MIRSFLQYLKQLFVSSMSIIGTLWTFVEIVEFIYPDVLKQYITPAVILLIAVPIPAFIGIYHHFSFTCTVPGQGEICIKYGNLLHQMRSTIVVNINDEIRQPEHGSLHWKITSGKNGKIFSDRLDEERQKLCGRKKEMGSIIDISSKQRHVLFLVSATIHEHGKSISTPENLVKAHRKLFSNQALFQAKNYTLSIPVSGTGKAGVNMSYEEVIELIAREYIKCCAQRSPTSTKRIHKLNIIIYPKDRKHIKDWNALCSRIDAMAQLCGECQQL